MVAEVFADALADEGIEAEIIGDDKDAVAACEPDAPQVVITRINRMQEDLRGPGNAGSLSAACSDLHGGSPSR